MKLAIYVTLMMVFLCWVGASFAQVVTVEFDSVPIQQPGGAITGCLVQAEGASIVIVDDCVNVAAAQLNNIAPTDTPDFIVDGHAWSRL